VSDDEDDPFEHLDESVGDRDGDPFESFEDVDPDDAESQDDATGEESVDRPDEAQPESDRLEGPQVESGPDRSYDAHDVTPPGHQDEAVDDHSQDSDAGGLGEAEDDDDDGFVEQSEPSIDAGTAATDAGFEDVEQREGDPFEDVFEEMDVGEIDPDTVWESIAAAESEGPVSRQTDSLYAEVSKHSYCEQCEFFSDPPDVHCSHDGTEILEFLDHETVRVVDCPIVAERKELAKHE
jgi:hypothetical protein